MSTSRRANLARHRSSKQYDLDSDEGNEGRNWYPTYTLAEFRQNQLLAKKGEVGPNSYCPDITKSSKCRLPPSVSFTRSARFAQGARVYISKHHNVDMIGQQSPGPKYNPALPKERPKVVSWGQPPRPQLTQTAALEATAMSRAGPATYVPNINAVKPIPPSHSFAPADYTTLQGRRSALQKQKELAEEEAKQRKLDDPNGDKYDDNADNSIKRLPPIANITSSSTTKPSPSFSFPRAGQYSKQPRGVPIGTTGRDMLLMTSSYVDENQLMQDGRSQPRLSRSDQDAHELDGIMKLLPRSAPSHSMSDGVRLIPHPPKWSSPHRHAGGRPKQFTANQITRVKV